MHLFGLENRKLRPKTLDRINTFIRDNKERLIKIDNLLLDPVTLSKGISLNCHLCPKAFGCCNGSPFKITDKHRYQIQKEVRNMVKHAKEKNYLYADVLSRYRNNIFNKDNSVAHTRDKHNRVHCLMMQQIDEDTKGCILQTYAIDKGLHHLTYKPTSCALYPLDIIVLDDGSYFVFSKNINDDDSINKISRFWDSVKYYPCMSGKKPGFIKQKKIYKAFEDVIRYYLGDKSYETICKIL